MKFKGSDQYIKAIKGRLWLLMITALLSEGIPLSAQTDSVPPVRPLFTNVSVDYQTGNPQLRWESSSSGDVAGYVVYSYRNNEGYVIDTLFDPEATSYIHYQSGADARSESYVVAAFDFSGNISPLSNDLCTIYATAIIDTCSGTITIQWNNYPSFPREVTGYTIYSSSGNGSFAEAGTTEPLTLNLVIKDFIIDRDYCFYVRASLSGGDYSYSNKTCISTRMQRPPLWINADYATVTDDQTIDLSFTYDPLSEINLFSLEKSSPDSNNFRQIAIITSENGSVKYSDNGADITQINYYRLSAVNNCNNRLLTSNLCSNILMDLQMNEYDIELSWTSYKEWLGTISYYTLYVNTGNGFVEYSVLQPFDTTVIIHYSDLMYEVQGASICFIISAMESGNPWSVNGESRSNAVCTETIENIAVPNLFTPDGDNINDLFRPVMSFIPSSYHLIISDRSGRLLFETRNYEDTWDGSFRGQIMPRDAYLWFLRVITPSGKEVLKTGTVTIFTNR